jgi:hypothetical protein
LASFPNTDLVILHDPEVAFKRFSLEQGEQASSQPHQCGDVLYRGPKNNNAVIIFRRIGAYIREVEVKRKQSTGFLLADLSQVRIYTTGHALLCNRYRIVLMLYKQVFDFEWQMLVDLTTHQLAAGKGTTRSRASSAAYRRAA